ncbi:MAG: hypothetical protein R3C68_09250 [Myxococcota bacterium]
MVFDFADFFERPDADSVDGGWVMNEENATDVDVKSGSLYFEDPADSLHRPYVQHTFGPVLLASGPGVLVSTGGARQMRIIASTCRWGLIRQRPR